MITFQVMYLGNIHKWMQKLENMQTYKGLVIVRN